MVFLKTLAIEILDNGFRIRSKKEQLRLLEKERIRKEIAEARTAFVDAFSLVWKKRDPFFIEKNENFKPFVDELSRFACGLTSDSPIARDLGIRLTRKQSMKLCLQPGFGSLVLILGQREMDAYYPFLQSQRISRNDLNWPWSDWTLRHLPSFAIDNAWSKDPDDAISIEGNRIWVHVSDPVPLSLLFLLKMKRRTRASTLYLPEKTIPMLHYSLIEAFGLAFCQNPGRSHSELPCRKMEKSNK